MEIGDQLSELEEVELANWNAGVSGVRGRHHTYLCRREWPEFLSDVASVPGGTVSRTEAAMLLRCSRQRIHQLVQEGQVECWEFRGGWIPPAMMYSELSVLDLLSYGELSRLPVTLLQARKLLNWNADVERWFAEREDSRRSSSTCHVIDFRFRSEVWYDTRDVILAMPPYPSPKPFEADPVSRREPLGAEYHAQVRTEQDAVRALERMRRIPEIDQGTLAYSVINSETRLKA